MTLIYNEDMEAYHASPAISNSKLGVFINRGGAYFKGQFVDKSIPGFDSKALKLGKAFDSLVFEGQEGFDQRFVIQPDEYTNDKTETKPWSNNATVCKAWNKEQADAGRLIVTQAEVDMFQRMVASMQGNPLVMEVITGCNFQVTVRTRLAALGITMQARPDGLNLKGCSLTRGRPYSLDLKTTANFSDWFDECDPTNPRAGAPIHEYGYHRQGAIDNCLLKLEPEIGDSAHLLVIVEKQLPNRSAVVLINEEYLDLGWSEVERHTTTLAQYITGKKPWPGNPERVLECKPPQWLLDQAVRKMAEAVS